MSYKRCTGGIKGSGARYNDFSHIVRWTNCSLEFQSTIVHVSSPVTLLVALWSMTSKSTRILLELNRQDGSLSRVEHTVSRSIIWTTDKNHEPSTHLRSFERKCICSYHHIRVKTP